MGSIRIVRINGVSRMQAQFVPALLRSPVRRLYSRHRSVYRKYSIVTPENATAVRPSPPGKGEKNSRINVEDQLQHPHFPKFPKCGERGEGRR